MYKNMLDKLKKFDQKYPYLSVIVIAIVASLLGITIQYLINGNIIGSGFYTTLMITIAGLIRTWIHQRRHKK